MPLNKPSPRLAILRAQLAAKAEAEQLQRDTMRLMALAPIRCKAPAPDADSLPLPPSYWDDLEHWLKTMAPAKPAAQQPRPADMTARPAFASVNGQGYVPTQQPAQKASTHSVCIKAYVGATGYEYHIGYVSLVPFDEIQRIGGDKKQHWLPCDESGWVTHVPTADSKCPVPAGVKFEARYGDGSMVSDTDFARSPDGTNLWRSMPGSSPSNDITAWRPIK